MVQEHSQHTHKHDTYHFLGPHIPKKLTSNYGIAGKGKIWTMQELENDFQLFLTKKYFAAFTFSIFSPLHFQHVLKSKMSLVHLHTMWILKEGKRGDKWMFRTEAPKGYCILHQLYLTDITPKLGQFHKQLYRKKKCACGHLWKTSQRDLYVYVSRYHISNCSQTGKNHPA